MRVQATISPRAPALMLPRWLPTGVREARSEAEAAAAEESAEAIQVADARPRAAGEGAAVGRGAPGKALAPGSVAERLTPGEGAPLPHSRAWQTRRRELTELRERLRARAMRRAAEPGGQRGVVRRGEADEDGRSLEGHAVPDVAAAASVAPPPSADDGGRSVAGGYGHGVAERRQVTPLEPGGLSVAERAAAGAATCGGREAAAAMRRAVFDHDGDVRLELSR
ncbi:hypothetical protein LLH23_02400 [bacterium]|nr:hypothetical protein [bacterium]